jgi:di/tricarboxylate transporter
MTTEMGLVLAILFFAFVLLVSEKVRMDVVALMVLGGLALSGLVTDAQALSGFSSPAVVTVWAVFILSGGLTRTGVANILGDQVFKLAGGGEVRMIVVIMLTAGVMSAFLNNVGVAALLLPVIMDLARRTGTAPSRLLMPLAFGALLGGLTTLIGTPPNILINQALVGFDLEPFAFFDYAYVGIPVMLAGVVFMVLVGRYILPKRDITRESADADLGMIFGFQERMCFVKVTEDSLLAGRTLAASRLGAALGLNVLAILREDERQLAPGPGAILQGGDHLIVEGRLDRLQELHGRENLQVDEQIVDLDSLVSSDTAFAEVRIAPSSPLVGRTLLQTGFRHQFGVSILAIRRDGRIRYTDLSDQPLSADDHLLIQANRMQLKFLRGILEFQVVDRLTSAEVRDRFQLQECLLSLSIPDDSSLSGKSLAESRLGDAFGLSVLGIERDGSTKLAPQPDEVVEAGDRLLVEGGPEDIETLRGLRDLVIDTDRQIDMDMLESGLVGLAGVVLSPSSTLDGKTLRQLHFRDKYGLSVLAIWRAGTPHRSNLRNFPLKFGDALLLYGPRDRLRVLGSEPDFLVLTQEAQEAPRISKAPVAAIIMAAVLLPVIIGWVPIAIAAVVGATAMVLTRCLTMEEAYRYIEWRAVFLIAGMLPLGIAMEQSGTAAFIAGQVVDLVGEAGTAAVITALFTLTAATSQIMPNAAVTVLMAPIAINTAADLGVSAHALAMVIAISASASFLSPVAHPANSLVMGPGGYKFSDYLKVGLPLTAVVLIVTLIFLPIFWT